MPQIPIHPFSFACFAMPKKPHPKAAVRAALPKNKPVSSGPAALLRVEAIHKRLRAVSRDKSRLRRATIQTLAEDLDVSRNTVKYDLVLLEIFRAPVDCDPARRTLYYTDPNYELRPPVWLKPTKSSRFSPRSGSPPTRARSRWRARWSVH